MAIRSRAELYNRFLTGQTPTQQDFHDLIETFVSRDNTDPELGALIEAYLSTSPLEARLR